MRDNTLDAYSIRGLVSNPAKTEMNSIITYELTLNAYSISGIVSKHKIIVP